MSPQSSFTRPATSGKKAVAKRPSPKKSSAAKKPSVPKTGAKQSAASKTGVKKSVAKSSASKKGKKKKGPATRSWRTGQQAPTPERYRDIEQALIDKGYLSGPASGAWGPQCVDALKRFQQDQNLRGDGKLDSLSLIALGLGPKRASTARPATPP